MGDDRPGFAAALDAAGMGEPLAQDVADMADLFADEEISGSPVSGSAVFSGRDPVVRRGPGRPKGARNRSTKEMVDFILARYRHPLLGLADIVATPPDQLALLFVVMDPKTGKPVDGEEGKLTKEDLRRAMDFWKACAFELAEYVATKQPRQLQTEAGLPPILQVFMGAPGQPLGPGQGPVMGMQETSMKSMELIPDAVEVPRSEVPQSAPPAADAADVEPSGS